MLDSSSDAGRANSRSGVGFDSFSEGRAMNRIVAWAITCLGLLHIAGSGTSHAHDEPANELKRLEGVWASTPAKRGQDRGHVLVFQGGRMGWRSFQTQDGEA